MTKRLTAPQLINSLDAMAEANGWTRQQLATYFDVSPSVLSDVMNGRRDPVKKILDVLELTKVTLYAEKEVPA